MSNEELLKTIKGILTCWVWYHSGCREQECLEALEWVNTNEELTLSLELSELPKLVWLARVEATREDLRYKYVLPEFIQC